MAALDTRIGDGVRAATLLPAGTGHLDARVGVDARLGGPLTGFGRVELGLRPREGVALFGFTDGRVLFSSTPAAEIQAGVGARITF